MTIPTSKLAAGALRRLRHAGKRETIDWSGILSVCTAQPTPAVGKTVTAGAVQDVVIIRHEANAYLVTYSTFRCLGPTVKHGARVNDLTRETNAGAANAERVEPATSGIDNTRAAGLEKFKKGFGRLKGRNVFGDDAVAFQREMREEWQ